MSKIYRKSFPRSKNGLPFVYVSPDSSSHPRGGGGEDHINININNFLLYGEDKLRQNFGGGDFVQQDKEGKLFQLKTSDFKCPAVVST